MDVLSHQVRLKISPRFALEFQLTQNIPLSLLYGYSEHLRVEDGWTCMADACDFAARKRDTLANHWRQIHDPPKIPPAPARVSTLFGLNRTRYFPVTKLPLVLQPDLTDNDRRPAQWRTYERFQQARRQRLGIPPAIEDEGPERNLWLRRSG